MSRIFSSIDTSQVTSQRPTSLVAPLRVVQITEEQVSDPKILTKQIQSLQRELSETTQAARSTFQYEIIFKNVVCGTAGAKITLNHGFGTCALFQVLSWRNVRGAASTVTAPILIDDRNDASAVVTSNTTLSLRSYVAGEADIRVFA